MDLHASFQMLIHFGIWLWEGAQSLLAALASNSIVSQAAPMDVLLEINTLGVGVLTAGTGLTVGKVGQAALMRPTPDDPVRARAEYLQATIAVAYFRALILVGVFCLVSMVILLSIRVAPEFSAGVLTADDRLRIVFASNATSVGLIASLVYFFRARFAALPSAL